MFGYRKKHTLFKKIKSIKKSGLKQYFKPDFQNKTDY